MILFPWRQFADYKQALDAVFAAAMRCDHEQTSGDRNIFHKQYGMQALHLVGIVPKRIDDKGHRQPVEQ
jgi:hypothetical protein